jgi:hypothetical protein
MTEWKIKGFSCREGLCLPMDPSYQFGQSGLLSYFDELGHPFLDQPLHASIPIDGLPDFKAEKIFDLLSLQRLNGPVIEQTKFGWVDLNLFQDVLNLFL